MSDHHCHAIGCTAKTHPRLFMCPRHWRMLTREHQQAIWREYRAGQEIRKDPTMAYIQVAKAAQLWLFNCEYKQHARSICEANQILNRQTAEQPSLFEELQ